MKPERVRQVTVYEMRRGRALRAAALFTRSIVAGPTSVMFKASSGATLVISAGQIMSGGIMGLFALHSLVAGRHARISGK